MEHVGNEGNESVNLRREPKAFKIYFEFCSIIRKSYLMLHKLEYTKNPGFLAWFKIDK